MYKYVSSDDVKMLVFSDSNFKSESSYGIIIFNRIVNTNTTLRLRDTAFHKIQRWEV